MIQKRGLFDVLSDPSTSYWLKNAIRSAGSRDVVDALYDAELLVALLRDRLGVTILNSTMHQKEVRK